MEAEELIVSIGKQIEWYVSHGDKTTIENLLANKDRLVGQLWYLAAMAADKKTQYNRTRFIYKIHVCRAKKEMTDNGMPMNKAEVDALLKNRNQYEAELESEAIANKLDILLDQGNTVVRAMEQRVSYMKKEEEQSRRLNHA